MPEDWLDGGLSLSWLSLLQGVKIEFGLCSHTSKSNLHVSEYLHHKLRLVSALSKKRVFDMWNLESGRNIA